MTQRFDSYCSRPDYDLIWDFFAAQTLFCPFGPKMFMARKTLIAGNWKMNLSVSEGSDLVAALVAGTGSSSAEILVCPTFLGISDALTAAKGSAVQVGAQNCHWEPKGAFTGELSAELISAAGCGHVLLGHSERRQYFGKPTKPFACA